MKTSANLGIQAVAFALFGITQAVIGHADWANLWTVLSAATLLLMQFAATPERKRQP